MSEYLFGCCVCEDQEEWTFEVKYRFPEGGAGASVEAFGFVNCEAHSISAEPALVGDRIEPNAHVYLGSGIRLTRQIQFPQFISVLEVQTSSDVRTWFPDFIGRQVGPTFGIGTLRDNGFTNPFLQGSPPNFDEHPNPLRSEQFPRFDANGNPRNSTINPFGQFYGYLASAVPDRIFSGFGSSPDSPEPTPIYADGKGERLRMIPPGAVISIKGYVQVFRQ